MDSIVHPLPLNRQARYAVRDPVREDLIAILYLIAIFLFHPPSVYVRYLILFKAPEKV